LMNTDATIAVATRLRSDRRTQMKAIILFLATMLATGTIQAASFDCAKAVSKMEKAICGDPGLSRMDEVLGASYAAAKTRLSAPASSMLTRGQVSWLRYTASYCFVDYDAAPVSAANARKCLVDALGARIKDLDATGNPVAGFKTYLMVDDSIKISPAEKFIYTIQRTYPQVDSDSGNAIKLNNFLADIDVAKFDDSRGSESYRVALKNPTSDWLVKELQTDNMIGAYPTMDNTCTLYSLGLNRAIRVGDMFSSPAWQRIAKDAARDHFKALARKEKDFSLDMVSGYEQFELDPGKDFPFCVGPKGIFVEGFLPHVVQVFDGVTIGWAAFKDVLTPYARKQVEVIAGK